MPMNARAALCAPPARVLAAALGAAAIAGAPPSRAQAGAELPEVVVSAAHIPAPAAATPASSTVLTRAEIEASQATSLLEVLRQVPGLHVDQPGGRGGVSSVYLRGADPNFTVVLVDGVKVNDPTNSRGGSFDFSTLDVASVERVEVIRGPLSSVYGSDAIAGVISIVTAEGGGATRRVAEADAGSEGLRRGFASARGTVGESADYAVGVYYANDGDPVEGSRLIGRGLNASLSIPASDRGLLRLTTRLADTDAQSFPDDSGGPRLAVLRAADDRDIQEATFGLHYEHEATEAVTVDFRASWYSRDESVVSPGVAPGARDPFGIPASTDDNRFRRLNASAGVTARLGGGVRVGVGADVQEEDGSSDASLVFFGFPVPTSFDLDRRTVGVFAELRWETGFGLDLQGGVRLDDPEGFDSEVSPRVGAVYHLAATGTRVRANWGEGFKLPSFFALGNPVVGNAALVPETSRSFDVGLEQELLDGRVTVGATWFHNRFFDIVDFDPGPPPLLVNRSEVTSEGFELSAGARLGETLRLDGHLTYVSTDIEGSSRNLRNRPEWRGGVLATWRPRPGLTVHAELLHVGESLDSSVPTGDVTLDGYERVDVAARWQVTPSLDVSVAVDNLLDSDYEEFVGFPAEGRRIRGGVRLRF